MHRWLSQEEDDRRFQLYERGLSDTRIGRTVGVSGAAIGRWRKRRNYLPNFGAVPDQASIHVRFAEYRERRERVDSARLLAKTRSPCRIYRPFRDDPKFRSDAIAAYLAGGTINGVALGFGLNRNTFRRALRQEGLARPAPELVRGQRDPAVAAYLAGSSLVDTSRAFGLSIHVLRRELMKRKLLRPYLPNIVRCHALRERAVVDMLGRVPDATIARVVGCARNTVWKFRRSLGVPRHWSVPAIRKVPIDAPRPSGGSYHDVHKDERWSDWLEDMGATVW